MADTKESPLTGIVGSQLSSVEFVQDYVQLHFDGPSLAAITHPVVAAGGTHFEWGSPGYRDALCERIGKTVQEVAVVGGRDIQIKFSDGPRILISLQPEDYRGPEAAVFIGAPGEAWVVW